jgi:4-aminobutyrate aminotransferase
MDKYRDYVITGFVKAVQPIAIESAQGAIVTDSDGRDYIDCFAGIAVVNAGHCNPEVIEAARAQMEKLVHCASYVYHAPPVGDLAEKMAQIMPGARLRKSFFANSGAEAIEGAMKVAKLYTGKTEIISLTHSFHGRTLATLSVTGNAGRKRRGGPYVPGVAFAPAPYAFRANAKVDSAEEYGEQCARAVEDVLRFHTSGDVAAFIAEPVLGEGGIIVPPSNYFQAVKRMLDEHGILFIADEVQTGFGRTGAMFGIEHYGVEPDIVVTAKGIADGFPLGAFTTTDEIAAAFRPGDHLSTFGGNPVSCAAALANIEFLQREDLPAKALQDGEYILKRLRAMQGRFPVIGEVRGIGLMIGFELVSDEVLTPATAQAEAIRAYCLDKGVLVGVGGVYGNMVRIQPPLVITREQIDQVLDVLEQALSETAPDTRAALHAATSSR